jgi:hypothetical protein
MNDIHYYQRIASEWMRNFDGKNDIYRQLKHREKGGELVLRIYFKETECGV